MVTDKCLQQSFAARLENKYKPSKEPLGENQLAHLKDGRTIFPIPVDKVGQWLLAMRVEEQVKQEWGTGVFAPPRAFVHCVYR